MAVNLWSPSGDCHIGLTSGHTFIVPSDSAGAEVPPRFRRAAIALGCIPVGTEPLFLALLAMQRHCGRQSAGTDRC